MANDPLPKFAEMPGASLPIQPPFPFEGMSARIFPLRASLNTLQRFVDNYVNIVPDEIGMFRVSMPYVFLQILDYGKMAIEVSNYGWLAQREIVFNVALEWYRKVDGQWRFHDWASVAPFIFVDDSMSMTVGRSVYGWPKTIASIPPMPSPWIKDTGAPVNVTTVSTMVFKDLFAGGELESQPFLEVERDAPISNLRVPFDSRGAFMPWTIAANFAQAASVLSRDALKLLPGLGIMPRHPGSSPQNYAAMMGKMAGMAFPFRPNLSANTINLKQFRMSEDPSKYCYQALTNGPMRFTAMDGAGALGEERMFLGDLSGGHSIRLHQWPTLPIAQTLGLEVAKTWPGPGCDIAVLKPVAPFWFKADVTYESGTTLAWRHRDGIWHDGKGESMPTPEPRVKTFNTSLGASNRTIAGPFRFSDTTVRVLPLLAIRDKLEQFVDAYFNEALEEGAKDGERERLRVWAGPRPEDSSTAFSYVYMTITSIGGVVSGTDNIGNWTDYEISFVVPVMREYETDEWEVKPTDGDPGKKKWALRGVGLAQTFSFADNATAVASSAEVLGLPTSTSEFIVSEEAWMSHNGPASSVVRSLLQLETEVLPIVGGGEKAETRTILEIYDGDPPEATGDAWRIAGDKWGAILIDELKRKNKRRSLPDAKGDDEARDLMDDARALSLELLGNSQWYTLYAMKQFRDIANATLACYQSFVRVPRRLTELMDLREIERPLHVRIHEYPTLPLVEKLGLVGQPVQGEGGVVYVMQPVRPFWLSGTIEEALGMPLSFRSHGGQWNRCHENHRQTYLESPSVSRSVAQETVTTLNGSDPRRLVDAVKMWSSNKNVANGEAALSDRLEEVVDAIDPQTVIESLLSREWGNWDPNSRWQRGLNDLLALLHKRLDGEVRGRIADKSKEILAELLAERQYAAPWLLEEDVRKETHEAIVFRRLQERFEPGWEHLDAVMQPPQGVDRRKKVGQRQPEQRKELEPPEGVDFMDAWGSFLCKAAEIMNEEIEVSGVSAARAEESQSQLRRALVEQGRVFRQSTGSILEFLLPHLGLEEATKADRENVWAQGDDPLIENVTLNDMREQAWEQRHRLRQIVALARERCEAVTDAVLINVAKGWQKPDHVVSRTAVGPDRDRILPLEHSWDDEWYMGRPAQKTPKVQDPDPAPETDVEGSEVASDQANTDLDPALDSDRGVQDDLE